MKKIGFWEKVIEFMNLRHVTVENDEELYYFWKTRSSNNYELDYEEIRRISFYNPTNKKLKARVLAEKNFALLKVHEEENAVIKNNPSGVEIELKGNGVVSLDFGYFEG